jgi:hypothetical protein
MTGPIPSRQEAAGNLASEFQAMTFGNTLLGGIIDIAIDAASGAMHQYSDSVTIEQRRASAKIAGRD